VKWRAPQLSRMTEADFERLYTEVLQRHTEPAVLQLELEDPAFVAWLLQRLPTTSRCCSRRSGLCGVGSPPAWLAWGMLLAVPATEVIFTYGSLPLLVFTAALVTAIAVLLTSQPRIQGRLPRGATDTGA
jgi:hypothetical protein